MELILIVFVMIPFFIYYCFDYIHASKQTIAIKEIYYPRGDFDKISIFEIQSNMTQNHYETTLMFFLGYISIVIIIFSISYLYDRYYSLRKSEYGRRFQYFGTLFNLKDIFVVFIMSLSLMFWFDYYFELYLDWYVMICLSFVHLCIIAVYYFIRLIIDLRNVAIINKRKNEEIKNLKKEIKQKNKNDLLIINE